MNTEWAPGEYEAHAAKVNRVVHGVTVGGLLLSGILGIGAGSCVFNQGLNAALKADRSSSAAENNPLVKYGEMEYGATGVLTGVFALACVPKKLQTEPT